MDGEDDGGSDEEAGGRSAVNGWEGKLRYRSDMEPRSLLYPPGALMPRFQRKAGRMRHPDRPMCSQKPAEGPEDGDLMLEAGACK